MGAVSAREWKTSPLATLNFTSELYRIFMTIISCSDKGFPTLWGQLWERQACQAPMHTQAAYAFYRQRPLDEGAALVDYSFVVVDDGYPVAGMQVASISKEGKTNLQAYEVPAFVMEDPEIDDRRNYRRQFLKHFQQILPERGGSVLYRDRLENGELSFFARHLLESGGLATPIFLQILDLSASEEELRRGIRKSYRSLINWGQRSLEIELLDHSDPSTSAMDSFRELHREVSGRETRSAESWQRQTDMITNGEAFALFGRLEGRLVTAGFFMHTESTCLYGSSASARDLFDKPLSHAMLWTAILHAQSLGCSRFEMGERLFPHQGQPSKKELGISLFKGGFGGVTQAALDVLWDRSLSE